MKTFCLIIIAVFLFNGVSAQVGINTQNPKTTLHVAKKSELTYPDGIIPPRISGDSLRLKDNAYTFDQNGAIVFVSSPTTTSSIKTEDVSSVGFFIYDAYYTHPENQKGIWKKIATSDPGMGSSVYAARGSGNLSLISLGLTLFGSNVNYIPLSNTSSSTFTVEIPTNQIENNAYTVPSDGIYHINYSFRIAQGISAELLSGASPGLIITKTVGLSTTGLDYRIFGGVNLLDVNLGFPLPRLNVSVTLTQGQISHIYNLKAGDILRFGIVQGGLNVAALSSKSAEISIYKIR